MFWAIPHMLWCWFKAELHFRLAEEMMKETREEPNMSPLTEAWEKPPPYESTIEKV